MLSCQAVPRAIAACVPLQISDACIVPESAILIDQHLSVLLLLQQALGPVLSNSLLTCRELSTGPHERCQRQVNLAVLLQVQEKVAHVGASVREHVAPDSHSATTGTSSRAGRIPDMLNGASAASYVKCSDLHVVIQLWGWRACGHGMKSFACWYAMMSGGVVAHLVCFPSGAS